MLPDPERFAQDQLAQLESRLDTWHGWRDRTAMVRQLVSGDWGPVFGNDEDRMIANLPRNTVEDGGRLFAEGVFSTRCDPDGPDREKAAEKREMALAAYDNISDLDASIELFGEDLLAAGLTGIKVWPDFHTPIVKRFPIFERVDPQIILPEPSWTPTRASDNVMLHYSKPISELQREFPQQLSELAETVRSDVVDEALARRGYVDLNAADVAANPPTLEVVDWYSRRFLSRVCIWRGEHSEYAKVLLATPNTTNACHVQLIARPTWTNEPKGTIDDAKGALRTQNRLWRMIVDYFIEMVYGPIIAWNIRNPGARGPGAVLQAISSDAKYERVAPAQIGFQAFGVVDQMEEHARTDMIALKSRQTGDLQLNKATAAYLTGSQGQLNSVVKSLSRAFGTGKRHANEVALATDEAWCDAEKNITGKLRGRRFRVTYRPKTDIAGDYSNRVSFGTQSGLDEPTDQVLRLQKRGAGLLDTETFLEQDRSVEDVPTAIARLRRDGIEQSILAGLMQPDTPLEARLRAWKAFTEDQDFDKVVDEVTAATQAPAPSPVPLLGGGGAPGGPAPADVPTRPGVAGAEAPVLPPIEALQRLATRRR